MTQQERTQQLAENAAKYNKQIKLVVGYLENHQKSTTVQSNSESDETSLISRAVSWKREILPATNNFSSISQSLADIGIDTSEDAVSSLQCAPVGENRSAEPTFSVSGQDEQKEGPITEPVDPKVKIVQAQLECYRSLSRSQSNYSFDFDLVRHTFK